VIKMALITNHFIEQLKRRLGKNGISLDVVKYELAKIIKTDFDMSKSYAVRVKDLQEFFGDDTLDYYAREESNGSVLWMIIRNNRAVTFFLRRTNQPSTTERLRVDGIFRIQQEMKSCV
jgi:hypothetical protein